MTNNAWRLIDSGPGGAAWNMALDEALLLSTEKGDFRPTIRFFSWDRPSLSIGSFQKTEELDISRMEGLGVPLVRRPTGGRAVLHDAELTYSITCRIPSDYFSSDLMGSYRKIGSCFIRGLKLLGVEAELVPVRKDPKKGPPQGKNPLCFSSPSWYEVLAGGKKLVGSAQRRLRGAFLQQGSLLIKLDIDGLLSLMAFNDDSGRKKAYEGLKSKMTALSLHGPEIGLDELKGAIIQGLSVEMGADVLPGEPTPAEESLARQLMEEKYLRPEWNLNRNMPKKNPGSL
ncbi:MAG: biotin/lipoate A/B protein ligase family protein [Nitrospirota bacterium]